MLVYTDFAASAPASPTCNFFSELVQNQSETSVRTRRKRSISLTLSNAITPTLKASKCNVDTPARADSLLECAASQFDLLQRVSRSLTYSFDVSLRNAQKNRYPNVQCAEHSRVCLKNETYINANFLTPQDTPTRFIATQAPLPHTIAEFYHMVVEQRARVIVCLTKFEIGRANCYFPSVNTSHQYGDVCVTTRGSVQFGRDVTIRCLAVQRKQDEQPHVVMHLYYTGWPDFGVPSSQLSLLRLFWLAHSFNKRMQGELIVTHCSAGIGRAGTFVAASMLMEQTFAAGSWTAIFQQVELVDRMASDAELPTYCEASDASLFVNVVAHEALQQNDTDAADEETLAAAPADAISPDIYARVFRLVIHLRKQRRGCVQTAGQYYLLLQLASTSQRLKAMIDRAKAKEMNE